MRKNKTATKLLCAILALGATGITAYAANTASASSTVLSSPMQTQTGEKTGGSSDSSAKTQGTDVEDAEDQAQQAAQAKITKAEAIAAAQAANPGWNFSKSELDSENGTILYELKGTDVNGQKQNIHVNAMDGTIVQETADHE